MINNQTKESIAHLREILLTAEHSYLEAVAQAKIDGASWAEIADITGSATRQAAQQKFAQRVEFRQHDIDEGRAGTSYLEPSMWLVHRRDISTPKALGGSAPNLYV